MLPADPVRLTKLAKRAGCAAKHPPGFLLPLLGMLPPISDPNVLVGSCTADDAAIYKLSDDLALVLTTDFFTPVVDDPRDFGRVAAANALSDVYAMGGTPLAALSIVGFPDALPAEILGEILQGAHAVALESGINIVGGHTIKSEEPTFGLAVVGKVHPGRAISNAGAKPGDALILTKPVGVGVITTAAKNDQDTRGAIVDAIRLMTTLNRVAAEVFTRFEAHALTDVTGFGLLGHLRNVTAASKRDRHGHGGGRASHPGRARVRRGRHRPRRHPRQPQVPGGGLGDVRRHRPRGAADAVVRRANIWRFTRGSARGDRGRSRRGPDRSGDAGRGNHWASGRGRGGADSSGVDGKEEFFTTEDTEITEEKPEIL